MQRTAFRWTKQRLSVQPTDATNLHPARTACEVGRQGRQSHSLSLLSEAHTLIRCSTLQSSFFFFLHRTDVKMNLQSVSTEQSRAEETGGQGNASSPSWQGKPDRMRQPSQAAVVLLETRPFLSNARSFFHLHNHGIRAGGITNAAISLRHTNGGCNATPAAALTFKLDACQVIGGGGEQFSIQSLGFVFQLSE